MKVVKRRLYNPNLAKLHRNYSVEDAADLYGVFKGTVRAWIKAGLQILNQKRPMLIKGSELAAYHRARRTKNKHTCKAGEMYCLKCRIPKKPDGNMVDLQTITEKIGNLVGICPTCYTIINRRVSIAKLEQVRGEMDITMPLAQRHIVESKQPSVDSDLKQEQTA